MTYLDRGQRTKFLAEKLALVKNAERFFELYANRAAMFETTARQHADQEFRTFLQPYIDLARAIVNQPSQDCANEGEEDEDEDEDEEKYCVICDELLPGDYDGDVCEDCVSQGV